MKAKIRKKIKNLSYSTISNYDTCPKKVYFEKILGIESIEPDYFKFGHRYHEAVENYHRGKKYNKKLIKAYTAEIAQDYYKAEDVEVWIDGKLEFGDYETELPMIGRIDGVRAKELVDLKTANGSMSQRQADESDQPTMYMMLWYQKNGVIPKFRYIIYNKKTKKLLQRTTERSQDDFKAYFHHAKEVENSILAGKFKKTPGWQCRYCQYKRICV